MRRTGHASAGSEEAHVGDMGVLYVVIAVVGSTVVCSRGSGSPVNVGAGKSIGYR
jgi:hypothetical protein